LVRKFSISLMVALVLVAMLWGNCLSCPQVTAAHSCCHKPQPASAACHTQSLQHFVKAETPAPTVPAVALLAEVPATTAELPELRISARIANVLTPPGAAHSPLTLRI
jgi:hypothetical protein